MIIPLPDLKKAICLGRLDAHTIDVAVQDGPIQKLGCPTDRPLPSCAVLGSRIWFSETEPSVEGTQGTWELAEVDGGYLTCVNPLRVKAICLQGFENKGIEPFVDYSVQPAEDPAPFDVRLKHNESGEELALAILPVILGDEIHRGFFPDAVHESTAHILRELIKARYQNKNVGLCLAVANNGIQKVYLADHIDRQVGGLVRDAADIGVKIFAHQVEVSLEQLKLGKTIPFIVPQAVPRTPHT
jgi:sugar fermentation stimulation protein A